MNILKDNKVRICYFLSLLFIMLLSVGYSAFNVSLNVEDIVAYVRVKKDIRITDFAISKTNSNAISEYEEYNYDKVSTLVDLPNSDSSITYRVELTNIETAEMGIFDITGLQDNLEYEVSEYILRDRICDDSNKCNLGIVKDIYLTIRYKDNGYDEDNTKYDINLDFIFKEIFDITYSGIENNGYSEYIMEGEDLEITFKDFIPYNVVLYVDGVKLDYDKYSYEDGILRYNEVTGNVLIEYIEKVYLTTLSEGTYFKEDEYREKIKAIEFVDYVSVASDNIETYDLSKNQDGSITGWIDKDYNLYVGSDWEIYGTNLSNAFKDMKGVEEITFNNLDTSEATNMRYMFHNTGYDASTFKITGMDNWDTSNVGNMQEMFQNAGYNANEFDVGDLSKWNTSKVTSMYYMFYNAGKSAITWNIGDLSGWDVSNVTNMNYMFWNAGNKSTTFDIGNLSEWDVSSVTSMLATFGGAGKSSITWNIGDLSNWNVSNVTNMNAMFAYSGQDTLLWSIGDLSNWDVSNVTDMSNMFNFTGWSSTTFDLGDLSSWDVSNVISMVAMFSKAGRESEIWNIGDLSGWDVSKVTNMRQMFFDIAKNADVWNIGDLSKWDVSSVTDMKQMFCTPAIKATTWNIGDLSKWDTSSVTDMNSMFNQAGYRATIFNIGDISGWDTSKVTNMEYMFNYAGYQSTNDWSLDLRTKEVTREDGTTYTAWDVSNVTSYSGFNDGNKTKITPPTWVN